MQSIIYQADIINCIYCSAEFQQVYCQDRKGVSEIRAMATSEQHRLSETVLTMLLS